MFYLIECLSYEILFFFEETSSDVETKQVERESKEPSSEPQYKDAEKVPEGEEEADQDDDSEYEDVDEEEEEEEHETPTSNKPAVKVILRTTFCYQ